MNSANTMVPAVGSAAAPTVMAVQVENKMMETALPMEIETKEVKEKEVKEQPIDHDVVRGELDLLVEEKFVRHCRKLFHGVNWYEYNQAGFKYLMDCTAMHLALIGGANLSFPNTAQDAQKDFLQPDLNYVLRPYELSTYKTCTLDSLFNRKELFHLPFQLNRANLTVDGLVHPLDIFDKVLAPIYKVNLKLNTGLYSSVYTSFNDWSALGPREHYLNALMANPDALIALAKRPFEETSYGIEVQNAFASSPGRDKDLEEALKAFDPAAHVGKDEQEPDGREDFDGDADEAHDNYNDEYGRHQDAPEGPRWTLTVAQRAATHTAAYQCAAAFVHNASLWSVIDRELENSRAVPINGCLPDLVEWLHTNVGVSFHMEATAYEKSLCRYAHAYDEKDPVDERLPLGARTWSYELLYSPLAHEREVVRPICPGYTRDVNTGESKALDLSTARIPVPFIMPNPHLSKDKPFLDERDFSLLRLTDDKLYALLQIITHLEGSEHHHLPPYAQRVVTLELFRRVMLQWNLYPTLDINGRECICFHYQKPLKDVDADTNVDAMSVEEAAKDKFQEEKKRKQPSRATFESIPFKNDAFPEGATRVIWNTQANGLPPDLVYAFKKHLPSFTKVGEQLARLSAPVAGTNSGTDAPTAAEIARNKVIWEMCVNGMAPLFCFYSHCILRLEDDARMFKPNVFEEKYFLIKIMEFLARYGHGFVLLTMHQKMVVVQKWMQPCSFVLSSAIISRRLDCVLGLLKHTNNAYVPSVSDLVCLVRIGEILPIKVALRVRGSHHPVSDIYRMAAHKFAESRCPELEYDLAVQTMVQGQTKLLENIFNLSHYHEYVTNCKIGISFRSNNFCKHFAEYFLRELYAHEHMMEAACLYGHAHVLRYLTSLPRGVYTPYQQRFTFPINNISFKGEGQAHLVTRPSMPEVLTQDIQRFNAEEAYLKRDNQSVSFPPIPLSAEEEKKKTWPHESEQISRFFRVWFQSDENLVACIKVMLDHYHATVDDSSSVHARLFSTDTTALKDSGFLVAATTVDLGYLTGAPNMMQQISLPATRYAAFNWHVLTEFRRVMNVPIQELLKNLIEVATIRNSSALVYYLRAQYPEWFYSMRVNRLLQNQTRLCLSNAINGHYLDVLEALIACAGGSYANIAKWPSVSHPTFNILDDLILVHSQIKELLDLVKKEKDAVESPGAVAMEEEDEKQADANRDGEEKVTDVEQLMEEDEDYALGFISETEARSKRRQRSTQLAIVGQKMLLVLLPLLRTSVAFRNYMTPSMCAWILNPVEGKEDEDEKVLLDHKYPALQQTHLYPRPRLIPANHGELEDMRANANATVKRVRRATDVFHRAIPTHTASAAAAALVKVGVSDAEDGGAGNDDAEDNVNMSSAAAATTSAAAPAVVVSDLLD